MLNNDLSPTLEYIITKLDQKNPNAFKKPVIVMDAGISTENNIEFLRTKGYQYLCVSRSNLKEYKADTSNAPVKIFEKRDQQIKLQRVNI